MFWRVLRVILYSILWIFAAVSVVVLFSVRWLLTTWADMPIDELVYHLSVSLEGTSSSMVWEYILKYGIIELLVIVAFIVIAILLRKKKALFYASLFICSVTMLVTAVLYMNKKTELFSYAKAQFIPSSFIEDNYVSPDSVEIDFPEDKRNLIYIYLESMEVTYTSIDNGGAFQQNIIPELVDMARNEGENFSGDSPYINGGISLPGSTWTMGAMFAESTGLPLKTDGINANYIVSQDSIYPSVISIGDILEEEGYNNELLLGSNAYFGGRRTFFSGHGDYFLYDYNYVIDNGILPEDYYVWWGYEDKKLFEYAKDELARLSEETEPFNLTLLTVDTHFEDGYLCEDCGDEYYEGDRYSNVMACSSKRVYDFVKWVQEQDFYEDTTIVISGDHPTMDKDFCATVSDDYQRKVYTAIINSATQIENSDSERVYSTMDLFPTTLAAMGVSIEGDRLGMGVNLFSGEETLIEKYGVDKCKEEIDRKSKFMSTLNSIEFNENLLANIAGEASVSAEEQSEGIILEFRANATFEKIEGFSRLEADIWEGGIAPRTIILDGYNSSDKYYYNMDEIEDIKLDDLRAIIYYVDDNGDRYEIKRYGE